MSRKLLLRIIVVLFITNVATLLFWGQSQSEKVFINDEETEINNKKAVANIDGSKITYEQWMDALRSNYGEKQLKAMVDRKVVEQLAKEKDIKISDKVIDREIANLISVQGVMTKKEAEDLEKEWRKDVKYRYQLEALLTEDITIPEDEIKTYYDGYHKQYDFNASIQLSHIIVQNMETANKVIKELEEGASFPLLAAEYSKDESTNKAGGYLGFYTETSQFLPPGYRDVITNMDEASYSEPFITPENTVAIIYLHQYLPEITFTYDEIKPYIRTELALEKSEQTLSADSLWDKQNIEWVYGR